MEIWSPEFDEGETIPRKFTCQGADTSPRLEWSDVPEGTAELLLIVDDPDAPGGTWVHWVMAGIHPSKTGLVEGEMPVGTVEGINGFNRIGWGGPCPPKGHGPHRYFFALYALSAPAGVSRGVTADEARAAVKDLILAEAQTMCRYEIR